MQRINSYYTDQQVAALQSLATMSGNTVSELLRRAVDMYLQRMYDRGLLTRDGLPPPVDEAEFAHVHTETIEAA